MSIDREAALALTRHFRAGLPGRDLLASVALAGKGVPGLTVTVDWCEFLGATEAEIIEQLCAWWQVKVIALTVQMDDCGGISADLAKFGRSWARADGWQGRCRPLAASTWAAMQR
jgi:hypothetical protein